MNYNILLLVGVVLATQTNPLSASQQLDHSRGLDRHTGARAMSTMDGISRESRMALREEVREGRTHQSGLVQGIYIQQTSIVQEMGRKADQLIAHEDVEHVRMKAATPSLKSNKTLESKKELTLNESDEEERVTDSHIKSHDLRKKAEQNKGGGGLSFMGFGANGEYSESKEESEVHDRESIHKHRAARKMRTHASMSDQLKITDETEITGGVIEIEAIKYPK